MKQRISPRDERFIDFYLGKANRNACEAARMCEIPLPVSQGPRMLKRLRKVIETKSLELAEASRFTAERVIEELCKVAGDDSNPAQKVRALEVLAKIHGLTNDKVTVTIDRKAVTDDLDKALDRLSKMPTLSLPGSRVEANINETNDITESALVT